MTKRTLYVIFVCGLWVGCTMITPIEPQQDPLQDGGGFSHDDFTLVLDRFVDARGFVDYQGLIRSRQNLERYYLLLSRYSPESHPGLFTQKDDMLAYWINAYNASVIKTVLAYYPIASVLDIKPPAPFGFLSEKTGFFLFQQVQLGGRSMSLYTLENGIIRKRYKDPRIHFVLNCASRSCPPLLGRVFTGAHLNKQLDQAAIAFLNDDANLRIDHQKRTVYISKIFKWYRKDFLNWYQRRYPGKDATLLDYIVLYVSPEKADAVEAVQQTYKTDFLDYDWRLNDQ